MSSPTPPVTPDLDTLIGLFFPDPLALGRCQEVAPEDMPAGYRRLLAHTDHMTVTVEAYHGSLVDVEVLDRNITARHYARKILLKRQSDGGVVQFGIMRIALRHLSPEVRDRVLREDTPLGRILIEHNVLRRVHLATLWRIEAGGELAEDLEVPEGTVVYGRTALIECDDEPAVELLEIVIDNAPAGNQARTAK